MKVFEYNEWEKMSHKARKEILAEEGLIPKEELEIEEPEETTAEVETESEAEDEEERCADCVYERCPHSKDCCDIDPDPDVGVAMQDPTTGEYGVIHSSDQRVERKIINNEGQAQLIAADTTKELDRIEAEIKAGVRLTDGLLHYTMHDEEKNLYIDCTGRTLEELQKDIADAKAFFGIE